MTNWRVVQQKVFDRAAEKLNYSLDTQYLPDTYKFHQS
jgi:hypothetical protein